MNNLVLVSDSCLESFAKLYPDAKRKAVKIENIICPTTIKRMAEEASDDVFSRSLSFVSVCRVSYVSKGLDRAIEAFSRLKKEGRLDEDCVWYVIGDGPDFNRMNNDVIEKGLNDHIVLLGTRNNPYCVEKNADCFLLPSRYEGKPIAVTEAQILGIPPLVCNYSSAREQIRDGVDGLIAANDDDDVYRVIRYVIENPSVLKKMQNELVSRDYSNAYEITKLDLLIGG